MALHASPAPWWLAVALAGLSLLTTCYLEWSRGDKTNIAKVSALEQKQMDTTDRLDRIENKLDRILDWSMGAIPIRHP